MRAVYYYLTRLEAFKKDLRDPLRIKPKHLRLIPDTEREAAVVRAKLPVYACRYLVELKMELEGPTARFKWRLQGLRSQPELNGHEVDIMPCPENDKVMDSLSADPQARVLVSLKQPSGEINKFR